MSYTTAIIPKKTTEITIKGESELDLKAICIFSAIGFFLDDDTYWNNKKVLRPASHHKFAEDAILETSESYFKWHYSPRNISFSQALEEFTALFETIIKEQTEGQKVILPLSGGLDSRTQATALHYLKADVSSYSYEFENGYPETKIARQIAATCGFDFQSFKIKKGYLWKNLDALVKLNGCYSDFTSPRQMAVIEEFSKLGDVFSLGHWGDVLFDSYKCPELTHDGQVLFLYTKLVKRGGLEFAETLWNSWSIDGDFKSYLLDRISKALHTIGIEDTNAKLRVFKSKYWAPRWTSVNLSVFQSVKPITLPYYDNRMCEFICTLPEAYLEDRQLQIAYIKKRNPDLAKLTWQDHRPFNLYSYSKNKTPYNLPFRLKNKALRTLKSVVGKPYVQRNWELQFLGDENRNRLESVLSSTKLNQWIPEELIQNYLFNFYHKDALQNAHPVNMLLVLAKFHENKSND